jgi:hypothetical protein
VDRGEDVDAGAGAHADATGSANEDGDGSVGGCTVRDVWAGVDLGRAKSHVKLTLRPHASAFLVLGRT